MAVTPKPSPITGVGTDLLVVGAPHRAYASISPTVPVMDVWNVLGTDVS